MFKKILFLFLTALLILSACGTLQVELEWEPVSQPVSAQPAATTISEYPNADGYVANGANAGANFGTATTLAVEHNAAGSRREAHLRFNLSSFTGSVHTATLRVFGSSNAIDGAPVVVQLLRDNSFSESAVTYAIKLEPLPIELGRVYVNSITGAWYEFDVTGLVRQKKRSGSSSIEFMLHSPVDSDFLVRFNSREAALNKPELVINTASALFVVGNTMLGPGDAAVRTRLQELGYALTIKSAADANEADASGKSLVVISSTVDSRDVNTKFTDVAVPVVLWDNELYADMKMTGTVSGTDFGATNDQTTTTILDQAHALAAGREGTVAVAETGSLTWGRPGASALMIAGLAQDRSKYTIFAYEKGTDVVGQMAPARRVGLFLQDNTAALLTHFGWTLFDAAITWAANAKPFIVKKVLVLNYDPIIELQGNQRLFEYLGMGTTQQVVSDMLTDMAQTTNDYLRYEVVSFVDIDEWPLATDGTRYTDSEYLRDWNAQTFRHKEVDYLNIIRGHGIDAGISKGTFDEVWISGPRGHSFPASQMVGPNAFWVNGYPIVPPATTATRNYMIEYIEPTRAVALFQLGYLYRLEWFMRHVYSEKYGVDGIIGEQSNWNTTPYDRPCFWTSDPSPCAVYRMHFWDNFTLVDGVARNLRNQGDSDAVAGVGTAMYVPNATLHVDHRNAYSQSWAPALAPVISNADDWLYNFPNLTGERRLVSTAEWAFQSSGETGFMLWFNNHIPRLPGRHSDGVLHNWWEYVVNFNDYPEALEN
jgi:hypothetical protein